MRSTSFVTVIGAESPNRAAQSTRVRRRLAVVGLFVASLAWFGLGAFRTLELVDEGQIVYPIWRTAAGDVPYRDFGHAYWPSLFVLNALLLRVFGDDLAVLRAGLIVLKAVIAVAVYGLARTVARWWIALVAWALVLGVWGSPVWVFNTPYANHYALAMGLLAALVLLRSSWLPPLPATCAGVLTGTAATFKHTTGAFLALAGLVFLAGELRASPARRWLRGVVLVGAALVVVAYVARPPHGWTTGFVVVPVLAVLVRVALQRRAGETSVEDLFAFGAGAAAPVVAYVLLAALAGILPAFLRETVTGIGTHLAWGMTLPPPQPNLLAALGALAAWAVALAAWGRGRFGRAVAAAGAAAGAAGWAWTAPGGLAITALHWLPVVAVAAATVAWWVGAADAVAPDARGRAVRLVTILASFAVLALHPGADLPHALMVLPAAVLPAAWLADCLVGPPGTPPSRAAPAAVVIVLIATTMATPFVQRLWFVRRMDTRNVPRFARASGIVEAGPHTTDVAALLARLDALAPPGAPVVVLPTAQMIYFLAGRRSAIARDEFALYMIATDIVPPAAAPMLVDQAALLARLDAMRPLVVVDGTEPTLARLRAALPALAHFLDTRCERVATVGRFAVCRIVSAPGSPGMPGQP